MQKKKDDDPEKANWRPVAKTYDPVKASIINGIGTAARDRAAIRALEARYKPGDEIPSEDRLARTIIVARLPPLVGEPELERAFEKFGRVKGVKVVRDLVTRRTKGYGFVEFEKERHCDRALHDGRDVRFGGDVVIIDRAISRTMPGWKPRRLGGGFGGAKDSGQLRFGCRTRPWLRPTFKSERKRLKRD